MAIYTDTLTLLLVMDPVGNLPIFFAILKGIDQKAHRRIILRESLIALLILTLFLFFGRYILAWMQLSTAALSVAGGVILFFIAIKMIFPAAEDDAVKPMNDPFIVPLAVPLVAGPAAMTMVMLFATRDPSGGWCIFLALLIAWVICTGILTAADRLQILLGDRGLTAMQRLMGMVLTTMAAQMFLSGIAQFFHLSGS